MFSKKIEKHVKNYGLDAIAHLPDPHAPQEMISVLDHHANFTVKTAETTEATQLGQCDKCDLDNVREQREVPAGGDVPRGAGRGRAGAARTTDLAGRDLRRTQHGGHAVPRGGDLHVSPLVFSLEESIGGCARIGPSPSTGKGGSRF